MMIRRARVDAQICLRTRHGPLRRSAPLLGLRTLAGQAPIGGVGSQCPRRMQLRSLGGRLSLPTRSTYPHLSPGPVAMRRRLLGCPVGILAHNSCAMPRGWGHGHICCTPSTKRPPQEERLWRRCSPHPVKTSCESHSARRLKGTRDDVDALASYRLRRRNGSTLNVLPRKRKRNPVS